MKRTIRYTLILITVISILALTIGCEDDAFKDAPSVRASASSAVPNSQQQQGLGEVSGTTLPPNHPPIGDVQQEGRAPAPGGLAPAPSSGLVDPATFGKQGPLRWVAPEHWKAVLPANSMRMAEYRIEGEAGVEPAELTIFHFGATGGGGVEANLTRWADQFTGGEPARQYTEKVGELLVYRVDASGTYDPGMAMGGGAAKPEQRVLGAIAETPAGLFFFKLVGPVVTLQGQEEAFDQFVKSFDFVGG